ncbi:MAG: phosphoribosyltransferase family protein, partial [Acidilobaceae archaeon]
FVGDRTHIQKPLYLSIKIIPQTINSLFPIYNKNTLIVDDVSDTGRTLQLALDYIRHYSPKEIKTVTLYVKPWTNLIPDYYAEITDKWLVFPWGTWEYKRQITQTK